MPFGNRVWLGTRLPLESRLGSAQQSSMLTYWYPASFRPSETNASATRLIVVSVKIASWWVKFQLLKPIGGVRANPFSQAQAGCGFAAGTASATRPLAATVAAAVSSADRVLRIGVLPRRAGKRASCG